MVFGCNSLFRKEMEYQCHGASWGGLPQAWSALVITALPGSSTFWPTSINIKNRAEYLQKWAEKCVGFCPATWYSKSGKEGSRALSIESPRQFPISLRKQSFLRLERNKLHARICLQTNPVLWYYCTDEEMTIYTQLTCQARITCS